jgi:hypothetical protein
VSFGQNDDESTWVEMQGLVKGLFGYRESDESLFVDFGFKYEEQTDGCWPWNG